MTWSSEDPRFTVYKRAGIIILRHSDKGQLTRTGYGHVETHQGYSIVTDFDDYKVIGEGDDWPRDWYWIRAPD